MKKYTIIILLLAILFSSCEDKDVKPVLDNENAVASTLFTPEDLNTYVFTKDMASDPFDIFTWSAADYGVQISKDYTLQIGVYGDDFANATDLIVTSNLSYETTVGELNVVLYDLGLKTETASDLDVRVMNSSNNSAVEILYSTPHRITITPYTYNRPNIISPINGSTFVFEKDSVGTVDFEEISWTAVDYAVTTPTTYTLEVDNPDSAFSNPAKIYTGFKTDYTSKVLSLNNAILSRGYEPDTAADVAFRVSSNVGGQGVIYSEIFIYNITPYYAGPLVVDPLYLVGNATLAGWNAGSGLPIEWDEEASVYSITTELTAGGMKILQTLGEWAPQWGDDGSGDGTGGNLIFRPDEATTDPAEIPSPGAGTYKIDVNIANLTYTITPA